MWEYEELNVKQIGEKLYLDSGTLTSVLKQLEQKGYVIRKRSKTDERNLIVSITEEGKNLTKDAKNIPSKISGCIELSKEEAIELYSILHKILKNISE